MGSFRINGGKSLKGVIYPQGAKNEALQILCAVLLSDENITIENVEKDLINRDFNDTNRSISPLLIPENAVIINSDDKSIKNVVDEIVGIIKSNS